MEIMDTDPVRKAISNQAAVLMEHDKALCYLYDRQDVILKQPIDTQGML